jgi:hypothetical protein
VQPEDGDKFHEIENYLIFFFTGAEKYLSQLTKNLSSFNPKIVIKLWFGPLHPGSRGQKAPDPGSGSTTLEMIIWILA